MVACAGYLTMQQEWQIGSVKVSATCKSNIPTARESPCMEEHARRWTRGKKGAAGAVPPHMENNLRKIQDRFIMSSLHCIGGFHLLGAQVSGSVSYGLGDLQLSSLAASIT